MSPTPLAACGLAPVFSLGARPLGDASGSLGSDDGDCGAERETEEQDGVRGDDVEDAVHEDRHFELLFPCRRPGDWPLSVWTLFR